MTKKRVRRTEEEWRALVLELRASQQPATRFARDKALPVATLYYWQKRLESKPALAPAPKPSAKTMFSEVVVVPRSPSAPSCVEVVTQGGRSIRIEGAFDADLLRSVLRVVESC